MSIVSNGKQNVIRCAVCGRERVVYSRGRVPKVCSGTCRQRLNRGQTLKETKKWENSDSTRAAKSLEMERINEDRGVESYASAAPAVDVQWPCGVSPIRELLRRYRAGEFSAMLQLVEANSTLAEGGCWEWPLVDNKGYSANRLYRKVLEASIGQELGAQAAHHVCANTKCVNPEHLQPVTHRENRAEMLARHSYLRRISQLESALRSIDPHNPLLNQVEMR